MGVYIKGMEMPESCFCGCPLSGAACRLWKLTGAEGTEMRHKDCPLVEVPDHGDLIDRDEMRKEMTVFCNRRVEDAAMTGNREIRVDWNDALDFIKNASVVIPAERREE